MEVLSQTSIIFMPLPKEFLQIRLGWSLPDWSFYISHLSVTLLVSLATLWFSTAIKSGAKRWSELWYWQQAAAMRGMFSLYAIRNASIMFVLIASAGWQTFQTADPKPVCVETFRLEHHPLIAPNGIGESATNATVEQWFTFRTKNITKIT